MLPLVENEPPPPENMEAAATRVYHMLLLLRANDKNIWPIIAGRLPRFYRGPQRAINLGKVDMPAVLDTLAFLSVLNDNNRVALTASVTPSKTTLLVSEDGPGNSQLSEHISNLWHMLREVKEAVDAGGAGCAEGIRRRVFRFLYNACFHHIATALRTHAKSFEYYTFVMQSVDDIDQPEKHSHFLRDIAVISNIVFDGSQCRVSLDGGHLDRLIEICSTLREFMKERDLLPNWTRRFRSAKDKRMDFSVEKFVASVCKLHIYISYILLFASTRSRHGGVLVGPFEVTIVSANAYRSGNVDASVSELFPLLEYAVDPQEREATLERLQNRLTTELPQLATQGASFDGHTHCECAVAVFVHNQSLEVSHIGISSMPCYACSRFLLAYTGLVGHFTNTFDRLFDAEFDLPWALPPPFQDRTCTTFKLDSDLTTLVWGTMSSLIFQHVAYMWSPKGSIELFHYKKLQAYRNS